MPLLTVTLAASLAAASPAAGPATPHPILFVTQVPIPQDFASVNATFGNQHADPKLAGRGGDLWIRYPDGTLRNLTAGAGWGSAGFQAGTSIAVRDPTVHWDGQKAVFALAVGAPTRQYEVGVYRWQLHEISGLAPGDTPVITRVPSQPAGYNNFAPAYDTDDRILFVSDRPRSGEAHLYPQLDEYELSANNTGLWRLDPRSGRLDLLDHSPSGDFDPIVDSFGRVVFTRWDHMQRDQQADADAGQAAGCNPGGGLSYGTFNYSDESAAATIDFNDRTEVFPEPRPCRQDLRAGTNLEGHQFNHFFPWMINPDGTEAETLNHIGRQELHGYVPKVFNDDPNVEDYYGQYPRFNPSSILNFFQPAEDPRSPGDFLGIDAPEFGTHAAGQVVRLEGAPSVSAERMSVTYLTHRETATSDPAPGPDHSGLYRDPLALTDGTVIAAHTAETRQDTNAGSTGAPRSLHDFRLKALSTGANGYLAGGQVLTPGIVKDVSYWDPDVMVTYPAVTMWELSPVEVRTRPRPARPRPALEDPEKSVFAQAGVDPLEVRSWLIDRGLALVVSRDVTTRDDVDIQQPRNLRVPGGAESIPLPGTVYDVSFMQFFQADQLRGWTGGFSATPRPGRRALAQAMHDPAATAANPPLPTGPPGSVRLGLDGSMASFVPARRAMTWQLTDAAGTGVVRERYWLTFQPGEVRVCASCHGVNDLDQLGRSKPANPPQALRDLLDWWKTTVLGAGACNPRPAPVTLLRAVKQAGAAALSWDAGTGATTDHYNLWAVEAQDKALIPLANRAQAAVEPNLRAACLGVPLASPRCTDAAATSLAYYQARAACADDTEGVAHP